MEIDAAVKSVLLVVESHSHWLRLRSLRSDGAGLDAASWSKRTPLLKIPRPGQSLRALSRIPIGTSPPIPAEAMMSIHAIYKDHTGTENSGRSQGQGVL